MATKKETKQGMNSRNACGRSAAQRKPAKAIGTRAGTLLDWRYDSANSGKVLRGRFNMPRDGR